MRPAVRLAALMQLPVDLRLDARLDRPRRGRPDPPADRAPRRPARDPGPRRRAPRRRQRDRRAPGTTILEHTDRPGRPRASPARTSRRSRAARTRTATRSTATEGVAKGAYVLARRRRARPTSSSSPPAPRCSSPSPPREQLAERGHPGPRRLGAVPRVVRRAGRRLPRVGAPAVGDGPRVGRGRHRARAGATSSATAAAASRSSTSAPPPTTRPCSASSASPTEAVVAGREGHRIASA